MKLHWKIVGALAGAAVLCLGVGVGWAAKVLHTPYANWNGSHIDIVLEPGLHGKAMLERLAAEGVLSSVTVTRAWLRLRGKSGDLRAGEYRFEQPTSAIEVVERLSRGDVLLHAVTLPEGLTIEEVLDRFLASGFGPRDALSKAFRDPSLVAEWDATATDLEGYLFPDTYHFPRSATPAGIAEAMVRRFRAVIGDGYVEAAGQVGLELRDAVTLASLIEKETGVAEERRMISSVFHNRLQRGMRMQCDPTVRFALARAGQPTERLSLKDLKFDSPWNTYVVRGLPPGPIASPGEASLLAAINPVEGDLIYFVAAPGGGHQFSEDLASHDQAVRIWRRYSRSSR